MYNVNTACRAKAVCYIVRQTQFRGLAEHTVNRLMEASKDQLTSLGRIAHNQETIRSLAEETYESLSRGNNISIFSLCIRLRTELPRYLIIKLNLASFTAQEQHKDMQQAQLHGQLVLENNIMRLVDEKRLIHETHKKLMEMTKAVQKKLENSAEIIATQTDESRINHNELLEVIITIQDKANTLFEKIGR